MGLYLGYEVFGCWGVEGSDAALFWMRFWVVSSTPRTLLTGR